MKIEAAQRLSTADVFTQELEDYLEGRPLRKHSTWPRKVQKLRSSCPSFLYRMILVSTRLTVGVGMSVKLRPKIIMSASDKPEAAVYAGSSFHHDDDTDLTGKQLVLVKIKNPKCCLNLKDLLRFAKGDGFVTRRILREREYIIDGTDVRGTVLYHTADTDFIKRRDYKMLMRGPK